MHIVFFGPSWTLVHPTLHPIDSPRYLRPHHLLSGLSSGINLDCRSLGGAPVFTSPALFLGLISTSATIRKSGEVHLSDMVGCWVEVAELGMNKLSSRISLNNANELIRRERRNKNKQKIFNTIN